MIIIVKGKKSKSKNNKQVNIIENDEILTVSKNKTSKSKIETKITNEDTEIDEIDDFKVSNKTLKPKLIINDDSIETKGKKLSKN